jgi:hypothetical protein
MRHRDATLILIAYRHGLRATEICDLEWSQVEFGRSASLHVRRLKNGKPSVHPLRGDELRALRELRRQFHDSGYVFATERGGPFTADAVNRHIARRNAMPSPVQFIRSMMRNPSGLPSGTKMRIVYGSAMAPPLGCIWGKFCLKSVGRKIPLHALSSFLRLHR